MEKWASATLRIKSNESDVAVIERELGIPSQRQKSERGEQRRIDAGIFLRASSLPETASISEHVNEIVAFMVEHSTALQRLRSQAKFDLFLGVCVCDTQLGFTLDAGQLQRLAHFDASITWDIYPPERSNRA